MEDFNVSQNSINPLSRYRTYSYHHIVIACDTTEVAEVLAQSTELDGYMRPPDQRFNTSEEPYAKYKPIETSVGNYCILINSFTDAELVIQSVNWKTQLDLNTVYSGDKHIAGTSEGTMNIQEPRGIKFLNIITQIADFLQINNTETTFLLKTVFTGYPHNNEAPVVISNIRPVFFMMMDVDAEFTNSGGTYNVKIHGAVNNLARHPNLVSVLERVKLNFRKTSTLKDALQNNLQQNLNKLYDDFYDSTLNRLKERNEDFVGKKVKYEIKVAEPYDDPSYMLDTFHETTKDTGATNESGILDLTNSGIVEQAIINITKRCSQVQKDAAGGAEASTSGQPELKYTPYVSTAVVITETEYRVVYVLTRVLMPRNGLEAIVAERENNKLSDQTELIKKNLMILNYIYTGRNVDVLDLDMKMNVGMVNHLRLISSNHLLENKDATQGNSIPAITADDKLQPEVKTDSNTGEIRSKSMVAMPTLQTTKNTIKNTTNQKELLVMQHAFENSALIDNLMNNVTITGNPGLLNSINRTPSEVCNPELQEAADDELFPYWERIPALLKFNIRMPADSTDEEYTLPFWFDSIYFITHVENKFDSGVFTQTLTIKNVPPNEKNKDQEGEPSSRNEEQERIAANVSDDGTCPPGFSFGTKIVTGETGTTITEECIKRFGSVSSVSDQTERNFLGKVVDGNVDISLNLEELIPGSALSGATGFESLNLSGELDSLSSNIDGVLSSGGILGGINDIEGVVDSAISTGTDFAKNSLAQIQDSLLGVSESLLDSVLGASSLDDISTIIDDTVTALKTPIDTIGALVDDGVVVAKGLVDDAEMTMETLYSGVTAIGESIADSATDAKTLIDSLAAVEYVPPDIDLDQITTFDGVTEAFDGAVTEMTETISDLGGITNKITNQLTDISDGLQEVPLLGDLAAGVGDQLGDQLNNISGIVGDIQDIAEVGFSSITSLKGQIARITGIKRKPTTSAVTTPEGDVDIETVYRSDSGSEVNADGTTSEEKTSISILHSIFSLG